MMKKPANGAVLTDDVTYSLIKILDGYEDAVVTAAEKFEPSVVARYIISLATAFNKFYHECPILQAEEKVKQASTEDITEKCWVILQKEKAKKGD